MIGELWIAWVVMLGAGALHTVWEDVPAIGYLPMLLLTYIVSFLTALTSD
jgi:hypothetical protein